jgi:hypothetical protein
MNKEKNKQIEEEIKDIVLARLDTLSPNKRISIGSSGEFGKEDLIGHVKMGDEIGKKIIEIEMEFLRAQKEELLVA